MVDNYVLEDRHGIPAFYTNPKTYSNLKNDLEAAGFYSLILGVPAVGGLGTGYLVASLTNDVIAAIGSTFISGGACLATIFYLPEILDIFGQPKTPEKMEFRKNTGIFPHKSWNKATVDYANSMYKSKV